MNELYEEAAATATATTFEHAQPTVVIYDNSGNQVNEFHVVNEKAEGYEDNHMKNKFWTHEATLLLIELYKSYIDSMKDPRIKKKDVWTRIAADMAANGYQFHGDMCDKKWRNLKKSYNGVLENNRGPGQGRRLWQYFDVLSEVFSKETEADPAGSEQSSCSDANKGKQKSASNSVGDGIVNMQKANDGKVSTKILKEYFEKQERNEERRMNHLLEEMRKMHQENLDVMKDRNRILQRLVDSLSTGT
ncbi:hypothetical protein CHUAL_009208 [Chamberlinius hualienensis]